MKTKILAVVLFMAVSMGVSANETSDNNQRAVELIERVGEIRSMDFKEMSRKDKRVVKAELREINKELKSIESTEGLDDKVSISIGAIVIIILLIIIL